MDNSEIATYHKTYATLTISTFILILLIPTIVIIILAYNYHTRDTTWSQNVNDYVANAKFLRDNNLPNYLDTKCTEYIKWVYSNRLIDSRYKSSNIKTIHDAYKWIKCNDNTINGTRRCNSIIDPTIKCIN